LPIERETVTSRVVVELRRKILTGALAEGTALRQESLAAELGVSRIPLREAIRQLEAEQLVTSVPHKGTLVAALSRGEIVELLELRQQLETWLFGLAIPRMGEADLAAAERLIELARREGSPANWGELNWRFHESLYRPAGRAEALRLLQTVHRRAERYINLLIAIGRDLQGELTDHIELVACARAGDIESGTRAIEQHIAKVSAILVQAITQRRQEAMELAG
jgi:DNA-binding GntR family transcriptional regulator